MNFIVFDAEANGLHPDKFHCLSFNSDGIKTHTNYDDMRAFLGNAETLVGHNIQRWDIPNLQRVLGVKVKARLIDTLAISWYLEPERIKHGLEEYGEEFGVRKPHIADWENLRLEDYVHRCERDVRINSILWEKQWKQLVDLYESEEAALRFLSYLEFKLDCAREQEEVRWKLNVDFCRETLQKLKLESETKTRDLIQVMPKVPVEAVKKKPAKPFKMNGELSKAGEDWKLFCENRGLDPNVTVEVQYIKDWEAPNPNSSVQVKNWLFSLGWKPETFVYKRNKETNEIKKIPQVSQDKTKGPGLCKSVLKLADKEPGVKILDGLALLEHRTAILQGFLDNQEDGYLKAEVGGLTNTLRFKHRILVNLPGVQNPYGEDIRKCLICENNELLCGSDMSGLEDRLKQHYIYDYDPDYVKEMNHDDYDPHLDLAVSAGAVTPATADIYKKADHKDPIIKATRHTYKQGNYACQYGARPARIALTVGCTKDAAQKIYDAYWKRNWAINAVANDTHFKVCNKQMWLYNPISKFWYSLRCEKDKFSTLVQGSAVFCFDTWIREVRKGLAVCGQFHDEFIAPILKEDEALTTLFLKQTIKRVNEKLKLNRELDIDIQYGKNYAEIH